MQWDIAEYTDTYTERELKQWKRAYSTESNLQTNCHLKLISKKWTNLQEATKHHKDNHFQGLEHPVEYLSEEYKWINSYI